MRFGFLSLALGALLVFSACGSNRRTVKITSVPSGATIYVNGEEKGQTPASKIILDFGRDPDTRVFVQVRYRRKLPGFAVWTYDEVPDGEEKKFSLQEEE